MARLRDGTLQVVGEYENEYRTRCFLLDKAVLDSPATRTALADKIAAYQKRREAGKQAVTTRVARQRQHHDEYLEAIGQTAAADELRHLLTAAYSNGSLLPFVASGVAIQQELPSAFASRPRCYSTPP